MKSKIRCIIKDKIINTLLHEIDKNNELNNKSVEICGIQTNYYFNGKKNEIIKPKTGFNYNNLIEIIKELHDDGFIDLKLKKSDVLMTDEEKKILLSSYWCEYITYLGKVKLRNGGFVKEYNDIQDRKRKKYITYFIFIANIFVISIYTLYTILMYYKIT